MQKEAGHEEERHWEKKRNLNRERNLRTPDGAEFGLSQIS
jgi:hypothetical protein